MSTALFGKVEEFDGNREDWTHMSNGWDIFSMLTALQTPTKSEQYFFPSSVPLLIRAWSPLIAPPKWKARSFIKLAIYKLAPGANGFINMNLPMIYSAIQ